MANADGMDNEFGEGPGNLFRPGRQFLLHFFDRQSDDVAEGAGDFRNNQLSVLLDGVGAGLIERIDAVKIFVNLTGRKGAKGNIRADGKDAFAVRAQLNQAHTGHDLMRAALQLEEHFLRFGGVNRFAKNLAFEEDESIGAQHERVGNFLGDGARFAVRIELAKLERRQIFVKDLLRVAGDHFEFQLDLPKQFRAARRG